PWRVGDHRSGSRNGNELTLDPHPRTADSPPAAPAVAAPTSTLTNPIGPAPAASPPVDGVATTLCRRPSVLVVDDWPAVLQSVHDLLRIDFRVITCGSGVRALEVLRSVGDIDVIMSDQRMPEMTGVELLQHAKAIQPETTRLLFTAYADI